VAIGVFLFILPTGIGLVDSDPDARLVLPGVGTALGWLLIVLGVPA
jgi:hypothetical protein